MSVLARTLLAVTSVLLGACANSTDGDFTVERMASAPTVFSIDAQGRLNAVASTPLNVPGQPWPQRQLVWMLADGSRVHKGEVVARFSSERGKLDLDSALVDIARNALTRATKLGELEDTQGQLGVDLSSVAGQIGIAHRYASAGELALARNAILDAVQDERFLAFKQTTLNWRKDQSSSRGAAELALVDAQRETAETQATARREDLAALEIRAPHDGLLVLQADWSGQKAHVGVSLFGGNKFASLPDTARMEVELSLPQSQAQGIKTGMRVELAPLGVPEQKVESTISWIAAAATTRDSASPVKYLSLKATVPADAVARWQWVPDQQFVARILLLDAPDAISVPNFAVKNLGETSEVSVREHATTVARQVQLGVRGPARSQVLAGLKAGEDVVLALPSAKPASEPATKSGTAPAHNKAAHP